MAQPPPPVMATNMTLQQAELMGPEANNPYYPEGTELGGGLPINLDSLRDGPPGSKPFYPYSTLIRYAIKGSPTGKLLLEDIYYAIESRFPYFRSAPSGWKNSVRHNLSLNPCFVKVPRPLTDRGKGSYWTVDDNVDPRTGVHRVRKKKPKKKDRDADDVDVDYHEGAEYAPPPHDRAPPASFDDPNVQYVHQALDDAGPSRVGSYPAVYPPTYDPSFQMLGMRYPPMPIIAAEEQLPLDEQGNVDWHQTWVRELNTLQQMTEAQEKQSVDQEWYRVMWMRVRSGLMSPMNPAEVIHVQTGPPPHGMTHPEHPDVQQEQQGHEQ